MPSDKSLAKQSKIGLMEQRIVNCWRRQSIRDWRRILKESVRAGDAAREKYARWMLNEILEDGA